MSATYVYGVLPAESADVVAASGLGDRPLRSVVHGAVAALVSDAPEEIVGRRRELMSHAAVLEEALRRTAVVPLRFGTVLPDDRAVVDDLLRERHDALLALLDEVRGRLEVRVRAYYSDEDAVLAEILTDQPALQSAGATLDERIRVGESVALALDARRHADGRDMIARLEPLSLGVAPSAPSTEMMVLNAAFLVAEERLLEFDAAVAELGAEVGERMTVRYVGPMPPASFMDLDLRG